MTNKLRRQKYVPKVLRTAHGQRVIFKCTWCKKLLSRRFAFSFSKTTGKLWKNLFCSKKCHHAWKNMRHLKWKRRLQHFIRKLWGTTPLKRFLTPYDGLKYGRIAEKRAQFKILPKLGFRNIISFSNMSNQFFVDFIAIHNNRRVLVDATIKLTAYVPEKMKLANALGMPLYILHISPNGRLFWLYKMPKNQVTSKVPMGFIRKHSKNKV